MKTKIILSLMTLMLALAACDRQSAGKAAARAKAMEAVPAILKQTTINPDDVFSVTRNGERVTLRWPHDFSSCKRINIFRNSTGMPQNRQSAAGLPGSSREHVDTLPDSKPCWYWLDIILPDGKRRQIGPVRAPADTENTGNYASVTEEVQLIAQRDGNSIIVAWDLPEEKYKAVSIKRGPRAKYGKKKTSSRTEILKTKETRGDYVDRTPDAEADYWYWIDATKEDGSVISKGPVKAEFGAR